MRIALAQINSSLGDFVANRDKILDYIARAQDRHCDLVIFPEAALFGYHPVDLLELESIVALQEKQIPLITKQIPPKMGVLIGAIVRNQSKKGKAYWNAAVFLERGKKPKIFPKQLLPTYDVFDESRHIEPGHAAKNIFKFKGERILVTVCEDIWGWPLKNKPGFAHYRENPLQKMPRSGIDLVVNLSASPFTQKKFEYRREVTRQTAAHFRAPLVYVNMVGGQDELIFDGGSFVTDPKGKILAQSIRYEEDLNVFDTKTKEGGIRELSKDPLDNLRSALVLGLRDFVHKTGHKSVHLGISGGIDSAVVACLAADALSPMNVTGILLPGPYTSDLSNQMGRKLIENLGLKLYDVSISGLYESAADVLNNNFGKAETGFTLENIQSRLRGMILMAYSNMTGSMLIGTTNKSELAVGYGTLYGDLVGGLMPLADLLKSEVYKLARHYNSQTEIIPNEIIDRPPSAELRPNQLDSDSLPPYDELDAAVQRLVVDLKPPKTETDRIVMTKMMQSEFKRWQAPPVLKISDHAFGRGRRFPVSTVYLDKA
ncbi:MAG: NAD+ synthase [Bdellovibrionales bacterium]